MLLYTRKLAKLSAEEKRLQKSTMEILSNMEQSRERISSFRVSI